MSFLSGFGKSLGSYLTNSAAESSRRKSEQQDWEWRLKKSQELEEQAAKTKVAGLEEFEGPDGNLMVQPVNIAGEPVGPARAGRPGEAERWKKARDAEGRKIKIENLNIENATTDGKIKADELANAPAARELQRRQAEASIGYQGALAGESSARTAQTKLIAKLTGESGQLPGRGTAEKSLTVQERQYLDDQISNMGLDDDPVAQDIKTSSTYKTIDEKILALTMLKEKRATASGPMTNSDFATGMGRFNPLQQ